MRLWHCLKTSLKFGHIRGDITCIDSKVGHQIVSLVLSLCLEKPFWHYQFVLSLYLHQPESDQLSLNKVSPLVS